MKNGDMPATGHAGRIDENGFACAPGMTKREQFAAMAMQGILANKKYDPPRRERLKGMAADAVAAAEALLAELERTA